MDAELERVKHFLWHGNTHRALELLEILVYDFDCLTEPGERHQVFAARLAEFRGYISANAGYICNYGERYRCGETVSSSIAESAVNEVISRRVVKKKQMRWSPRGAHLLLQLRTHVLNDELANDFDRWYPRLHPNPDTRSLTPRQALLQDQAGQVAVKQSRSRLADTSHGLPQSPSPATTRPASSRILSKPPPSTQNTSANKPSTPACAT